MNSKELCKMITDGLLIVNPRNMSVVEKEMKKDYISKQPDNEYEVKMSNDLLDIAESINSYIITSESYKPENESFIPKILLKYKSDISGMHIAVMLSSRLCMVHDRVDVQHLGKEGYMTLEDVFKSDRLVILSYEYDNESYSVDESKFDVIIKVV